MQIRKKFPQMRSPLRLALSASAMALALGCTPTINCGTWAFNGTVQSNPDVFPLTSAFTFTPATCPGNCNVQTDAMIQITWVFDQDSHTNLYAASGDAARADANGWNVDRINGEGEGWYGLENDGSTFYSGWDTTGSNNTADTLTDAPGGWPNNVLFYALDVSVCFRSSTCTNKILGYFFWSWTIDNNGNASKFIIGPAWQDLNVEFQNALAAWNAWAPTSPVQGGAGFPGEPSLPHAASFPAMSDL